MNKRLNHIDSIVRQDRIVLQALGLFVFTNLLWSGHRAVAEWIHLGWGTPAAYVAGMFFGKVPFWCDGSWVIPVEGAPIRVTAECDAFGFFSLVAAVSVVHVLGRYQGLGARFWAVAGVLLAQYLLTVVLNGIRIVGAYHVHVWAHKLQLDHWQALLHLGIGVLVFLPALIAVLIYWEKELFYE